MGSSNDSGARVGLRVVSFLLAALVGINTAGVVGIVSARRAAERAAAEDLRLQSALHARSLEALLAALRGDLVFLANSAPLAGIREFASDAEPMVSRWHRLDVEGSLLLFLTSHPEVERIIVLEGARPTTVAARRSGAPVLLPPGDPIESDERLMVTSFELGDRGRLDAWIRIADLVEQATPGDGADYELHTRRDSAVVAPVPITTGMIVRTPVRDPTWTPPIDWTLVRRQSRNTLVESVSALAGRFRTTVILNVIVMGLALLLGGVAYQQARRGAVLVAQSRERERIRQLEKQLSHSERLASVGRLAAGMAHEINNPLEGMANYLTLLEEDLRDGQLQRAMALAPRVREGLDRVAGVVRRVLAFSSPATTDKSVLDVHGPLREAVAFVRSNPRHRDLLFELELVAGTLLVCGNAATLGQLFLNLILNACEWQRDGGMITVRSERRDEIAVITVVDRGPGIDPAVLPHIFDPFFSTRGSTGLGLSVCHGIVVDHGGHIYARNDVSGGAQLVVELALYVCSTPEINPQQLEPSDLIAGCRAERTTT